MALLIPRKLCPRNVQNGTNKHPVVTNFTHPYTLDFKLYTDWVSMNSWFFMTVNCFLFCVFQLDCGIHPGLSGLDALPFTDLIEPEEIDLLLISQ